MGVGCAVIGVAWGFVQVAPNIRGSNLFSPMLIDFIEKYSLLTGVVIFLIILLVSFVSSFLMFPMKDVASEIFTNRCNSRARRVSKHEISKVHQLCVEAFGDEVANQNRMSSWHKVNENIFYIVEVVFWGKKTKSSERVGYFDLLPLNKMGVDEVVAKSVNGANFLDIHLTPPGENPSAIYIGGIYGEGFTGKGVALVHLRARLQQYERENGVTQFFTRPVTGRGLALVERNGFVPVDPSRHGVNALYGLSTNTGL